METTRIANKNHLWLLSTTVHVYSCFLIEHSSSDTNSHSRVCSLSLSSVVYQNLSFELTSQEATKNPELTRSWGVTKQDVKEDSALICNENAMIHDLGNFYFYKTSGQ